MNNIEWLGFIQCAPEEIGKYNLKVLFDDKNYMQFNIGFLGNFLNLNTVDIFCYFKKYYSLGDNFIEVLGYYFLNCVGFSLFSLLDDIDFKTIKNNNFKKKVLAFLSGVLDLTLKQALSENK